MPSNGKSRKQSGGYQHMRKRSLLLSVLIISEAILASAREEQVKILKDAESTRTRIISEAKEAARAEGQKELVELRKQIQLEKEDAIKDIRRQVATLSVDIAEKVLRTSLDDSKEQTAMIDRLIDESMVSKS